MTAEERAAIDANFAEMANDRDYLAESMAMAEEFVVMQGEAWLQAEAGAGLVGPATRD